MQLAAGTRLGPYEVVALIGKGGMGEVYRARDLQLRRDVAIKVLPAVLADDHERLMRFEREAQTLAALNHPHRAHAAAEREPGDHQAAGHPGPFCTYQERRRDQIERHGRVSRWKRGIVSQERPEAADWDELVPAAELAQFIRPRPAPGVLQTLIDDQTRSNEKQNV